MDMEPPGLEDETSLKHKPGPKSIVSQRGIMSRES